MVDNYNVIELLNDYAGIDDILTDIIQDIEKNDIIKAVKLAWLTGFKRVKAFKPFLTGFKPVKQLKTMI